ncbi:MAG TPA: hypothetical protein PK624_01795 [Spirochaetota bacterium]|nr:hypothetical protein [Spirochaetota bacterium]HOR43510.1 hypothetical protein [Spirochaetota bacterium]HOU83215.1 hypothetical protein [Spirochaetota bacterium]HPK55397.1 hypothetical protein [Spirochaetota bacterium]HQE57558.1 hypothetical protein [Spirochaetota bacterium]
MRYFFLFLLFLILSPILSKDPVVHSSNGTYTFKLTDEQLQQVSTTRKLTLNEDQKIYFKTNKNIIVSVFSSRYIAPEGIPYGKWIKMKEVSIESFRMNILLRPFQDNLFPEDNLEYFDVKMIFDIKANIIIDNSICGTDTVISLLDNSLKKYKPANISIYLSIPPHISDSIDEVIMNKVNIIKNYASENNIYLQDDF